MVISYFSVLNYCLHVKSFVVVVVVVVVCPLSCGLHFLLVVVFECHSASGSKQCFSYSRLTLHNFPSQSAILLSLKNGFTSDLELIKA